MPLVDYLAIADTAIFSTLVLPTAGLNGASAKDPVTVARANDLLALEEVQFLELDGVRIAAIWSDRDGPHIRDALRILGNEDLPVRYLDSDSVPLAFKGRSVSGEPVPLHVLRAMEGAREYPWVVRDLLLAEIEWSPDGPSWVKWAVERPIVTLCDAQVVTAARATPPNEPTDSVQSNCHNAVNAINAVTHDIQIRLPFDMPDT